jgi:hypothetical protein
MAVYIARLDITRQSSSGEGECTPEIFEETCYLLRDYPRKTAASGCNISRKIWGYCSIEVLHRWQTLSSKRRGPSLKTSRPANHTNPPWSDKLKTPQSFPLKAGCVGVLCKGRGFNQACRLKRRWADMDLARGQAEDGPILRRLARSPALPSGTFPFLASKVDGLQVETWKD